MSVSWYLVAVVAATGLASAGLTGVVRRYALARALLDVPNERSSHAVPTPRGGGLALVAAVAGGLLLAAALGLVDRGVVVALAGALPIAAVGWIDDRRGAGIGLRLAAHVAGSAWAIAWLGGPPAYRVGTDLLALPPAVAWPLALVGMVGTINFYNFMDGIDGIAGVEAVTTAGAGGVLLLLAGGGGVAPAAFVVMAAALGFLWWNRPPARIFLGDVGSGTLGFLLAALALASEARGGVPVLAWGVLLGVFAVDASLTLARRAARGERWYAPHRSHAYQRAVQSGWSHGQVTGGVLALNLFLAGCAAVVALRPERAAAAAALALAVVVAAYAAVERRRPMSPPAAPAVPAPTRSPTSTPESRP